MVKVEAVYFGKLDAMIAEVAAWDPRRIDIPAADCRYLVMPAGDAQFDTEWFKTKTEAREHARYLASHYECKVAFAA